jgi:hypothetical protein
VITKKLYNCLLDNDFLVADAGKENGREYGELYSWIGEMDFKGRHYDLEVDFMVSFDSDESLIRFVEQNYTTKKSHYEAVKSYDSEGNGNHIADMPDAEAMFKAMPEYSVKEMERLFDQLSKITPESIREEDECLFNDPELRSIAFAYNDIAETFAEERR